MKHPAHLLLACLCAILLVPACSGGDRQQMLGQLEELERMNRADSVMRNDTLAEQLVEFFDRHGTPNERMRAHYILGRTYADMGEAPAAVNAYQDAINAADTTDSNFDYYKLSTVYSQLATVFRQQLLLTYEVEARKKASHYAYCARDTFHGIFNLEMSAGAYILLNQKDSAEIALKKAMNLFQAHGYMKSYYDTSMILICLYIEYSNRFPEAKDLMDMFEANSVFFDSNNELAPAKRQYYYYKGKYCESINQLDSAEYYYRKVFRPKMNTVSKDPMYRGLLSVFSKKHIADSIAKYAQLFCMVNDSSIAIKNQDLTIKMAASYNYNRMQKKANENKARAYKTRQTLIFFVFIGFWAFILVFALSIYIAKRMKRREKELLSNLEEARAELQKIIMQREQELETLDNTHEKMLVIIKNELNDTKNQQIEIEERYTLAKQTIERINKEFDDEKREYINEISGLREQIQQLQQRKDIQKILENSKQFLGTGIVVKLKKIIEEPLLSYSQADWQEFEITFCRYYPELYQRIQLVLANKQEKLICMLTVLNFRNKDIVNLLHISKQQVTNAKSSINKAIFNESTSSSLFGNLVRCYGIYSFNS